MPYKFKTVTEDEVLAAVKGGRRGRRAEGADLVDEFLKADQPRAVVDFSSPQERDKILGSAQGYVKQQYPDKVWLRKAATSTGLILLALDHATPAEKEAYDKRPRGRGAS